MNGLQLGGVEPEQAQDRRCDLGGFYWLGNTPTRLGDASTGQNKGHVAVLLVGPAVLGDLALAAGFQDRCGYGPRTPLLVISPYAKRKLRRPHGTDPTSILRFIEDNWLSGQRLGSGSFDALAGALTPLARLRPSRQRQTHPRPHHRQPRGGMTRAGWTT